MQLKERNFECISCSWRVSKFHVYAEKSIVGVVDTEKVAYRNEFRYRLEKDYYHTVTDYSVRRLEEGKAYHEGLKLARTALPGRKSTVKRTPNVFYKSVNADYSSLVPVMKKKLDLSTFVSELAPSAGFHAQYLWRDAFADLGFSIEKEDVKEFDGRSATVGGDIDFIAKKDDLCFGVEVKNSLEYPVDLARKVQIAIELETIPVVVVRRVTWDVYGNLKKYGVLTKIYETAIMPGSYESVVQKCKEILGMPLIALDIISTGSKEHLEKKVLVGAFENPEGIRQRNGEYLRCVKEYRRRMKALDRELRFI
jgi:hypothetical protein